MYVVTIKVDPHKNHDGQNKKTGLCFCSLECTDKTGAHHSFIVSAKNVEQVKKLVKKKYGNIHITRIEKATVIILED